MSFSETLNHYLLEYEFDSVSPLTLEFLKEILDTRLGNDNIKFNLNFNGTDEHTEFILSTEDSLTDVLIEYNKNVVESDDYALIKIYFEKKENEFNIYNSPSLYGELDRLSFEHFYNAFNNKIHSFRNLKLNSTNNKFIYQTTLFNNDFNRNNILENWSFFTNIHGVSSPKLIPSDFIDIDNKMNEEFSDIITLFCKFSHVLSLIFLSDVVHINENTITVKINSYNRLSLTFNFKEVQLNNFNEVFKIYNWVYNSDNSYLADDKISFAKNQLSRKLSFDEEKQTLNIEESTLPSILSMHRIYLKENANQYIETTNTVAELISKIAIQQKEIQSSLISSLKNSSSVFLGLFISLLVFNTLSSGKATVFNAQNFYLTLLFALISLIALLVSRQQLKNDLINLETQFNDTKNVYKNLFNIDDLNKLFDDTYIANLRIKVNKTMNFYSWIWFLEIILVIAIISILSFTDWLNI